MNYWDKYTIKKIRQGYYSAVYFNRTRQILQQEKNFKIVTMQIFQKENNSFICGVDEVLKLLKIGTGLFKKGRWISKAAELKILSLADGDKIKAGETAMHIIGPYIYFAHLESLFLGILARRTLVATNTRKAVQAAKSKPVVFFADRFDHFLNQEGDGYAAYVGGAAGVCTQAQAAWTKYKPVGTIPHSLITVNNGNTVAATLQFAKHIKKEKIIALVDFNNNCIRNSLKTAKVLRRKLWGVRLDTAKNLIDKSLLNLKKTKRKSIYGVNPFLVKKLRLALDKAGYKYVKIIVSGGFNAEKIALFEKEKTPVDSYGVGSALVHGSNDFTADIVKVEGEKIAKAGRYYKQNKRLKAVKI
jgi:nicotinate phosphoribosyltransferase